MDFIKEMLADEEVVGKYRSIDETNHTPSSHGLRHIYGVVELADNLGNLTATGLIQETEGADVGHAHQRQDQCQHKAEQNGQSGQGNGGDQAFQEELGIAESHFKAFCR